MIWKWFHRRIHRFSIAKPMVCATEETALHGGLISKLYKVILFDISTGREQTDRMRKQIGRLLRLIGQQIIEELNRKYFPNSTTCSAFQWPTSRPYILCDNNANNNWLFLSHLSSNTSLAHNKIKTAAIHRHNQRNGTDTNSSSEHTYTC